MSQRTLETTVDLPTQPALNGTLRSASELQPSLPSTALNLLAGITSAGVLRRGYSWPLALIPAWVWGGESICTQTSLGPMCVRTNDRSSSSLLLFGFLPHEKRETPLVASIASHCSVMFDVGAQYGWYMRLMAKAAPGARVYAFEPDPTTYKHLEWNARDLSNAATFQLAVGAHPGETTFWRAKTSDLNSTVRAVGEPTTVRCCTLDDFCQEQGVTHVDFIKCDVEGGEEFVLRGAESLLRLPNPPIWMLEVIDQFLEEAGSRSVQLLDVLKEACPGAKIFTQDEGGRPFEICDFSQRILGNNVFFVPPGRLELFKKSAALLGESKPQ
jgi:FkbM family methyltransferase